ncbi:MAG: glycogen debranching enzyme GlgX, partial [Burkholderiales bacterium]
ANGEHNRDGHHHNSSWNCGVEGPTDDTAVNALRQRLARALLATLLLSQGTPMLLAGDELGHSQQGNNNAYCQDNTTTWLDWARADADLQATVAALLRLRREQPVLRLSQWLNGAGDVQWLEPDGHPIDGPAWQDRSQRALMIRLRDPAAPAAAQALLLLNAGAQAQRYTLPEGPWRPAFHSDAPGGACTGSAWPQTLELPGHCLRLALRVLTETKTETT